ncbi:EF-hand domain-containing protein [Sphingomonas sp. LHG3406-1]|uniref:EF-hand domain-containing protein n=1 Tax=Sphingomonas sp. LHG3406-1 TaxID=2804617 RepID=UPI00262BCF90|nr:EF-hand domain-containing protein [Sphingomonas sp. LHG3406-1]
MKTILLVSGLLAAATAAGAQVAPTAPVAPRDGIQTRNEVVERTRAMFARVDADRDGFITAAEGQALRGKARANRQAKRADPARAQAMFERLDANRDNMISRDEWAQAQAVRGQQRAARAGQARGRMDGQRMAMRGRMGGAMLRQADANRDQRISLAEAEAAALQRFDRADLNRDGRVTQDERQQLRQQRQQQRAAPAR